MRSEYLELRKAGLSEGEGGGLAGFARKQKPVWGKSRAPPICTRYDGTMRSRASLFMLLCVAGSLALPLAAHASGIPFFGPIIPQTGNQAVCPASWGMVMIVINNIIAFAITLAIVFVAPLTIGYAGFLYVLSPTSTGNVTKARGVLLNTVVGIVIALAGWMIVDAIMAVLYNPSAAGGTWSSLISSGGNPCLDVPSALPGAALNQIPPSGISPVSPVSPGVPGAPPSGTPGTACDAGVVKAGAQAGGYTLTDTQAQTLACIAKYESSCGSQLPNYNWGKGSTAYGAFQVLLQTHAQCYENSACYAAAGVSGQLNCSSGFSKGNPIPGSPVVDTCVQAASDVNCSAAAAACLLAKNGGNFSPWQADVNSAKQTGCINGNS